MKKGLRSWAVCCMILVMIGTFAGCGKKEAETKKETKKLTIETEGKNTAKEKSKVAVGTLVKLTENTITIKTNSGLELLFNANNCEHDFKNGIREGNWIIVTYLGEIKGTDTKGVKVLKITDNDPNTVKKEQKKMNIKAVDETVYCTADGVHVRASYSTDSKILGAFNKGKKIQRTGVCDNGWSRIVFKGADAYMYGDYLTTNVPEQKAPPKKASGEPVAEPPAPAQRPQEQPKEEHQTIAGIVVEVSMNTLTFNADGQNYTVYIADAAHNYKNGIQVGNEVTVVYTGNLEDTNSVIVISVTDTDPNTAAQNAVYRGVITDASMNTITIQTDDGAEMIFAKEENMKDNTGGLENGIKVAVTADTTAVDSSVTVIPAKQIDLEAYEQQTVVE